MVSGKKIIIAGGGLCGLVAAIRLARQNFTCTVIEKKEYPFHRVCGEYISNETAPFLKREGLYPEHLSPPQITKLQLSSSKGTQSTTPLDMGGFGVSRYAFDYHLFDIAKNSGVNFLLNTEVESIEFKKRFSVRTRARELDADLVIGAFGKRSKLDTHLSRDFIRKRSPYVGVKYHAKTNHIKEIIALHNFRGGYCGVSQVENEITNICYLTHRNNLKQAGSIAAFEQRFLFENPHLQKLFSESQFLFQKPEVINEISFETKEPVFDHIFMGGDAAGMITPLCGNGMAMAIHSAKILSDLIIENSSANLSQAELEALYQKHWRKIFSRRLWFGRQIQSKLFGTEWGSQLGVNLLLHSPLIASTLVRLTHGKIF